MIKLFSRPILTPFTQTALIYSVIAGALSPMSRSLAMDDATGTTTPVRRHSAATPLRVTPQRFQQNLREGFLFLSKEELANSKVITINGMLCSADTLQPLGSGHYMYFLHNNGDLYIRKVGFDPNRGDEERLFHSSFDIDLDLANGRGNCEMAGELMIRTNTPKKITINNDSGHYKPAFQRTELVEETLINMGYTGEILRTEETW